MIVDSSAWIDYLNASESEADHRLTNAIREGVRIVTPDPVVMEVLAGARSERHASQLLRTMFTHDVEPLTAHDDAEHAARLFRQCRTQGATIRSIVDCLVAAVAIRLDEPVLAADRDFATIATHSPLRLVC